MQLWEDQKIWREEGEGLVVVMMEVDSFRRQLKKKMKLWDSQKVMTCPGRPVSSHRIKCLGPLGNRVNQVSIACLALFFFCKTKERE